MELEKVIRDWFFDLYFDALTAIYFASMNDFNSFFASENYKQKVHPDESKLLH
ncbi:hypothetical protein GCM10022217_25630 [Chryseobacterium ginsenosidimutans]|uniref:EthD domain-containing protein n=1 Tax=Chryseobacterium ginsenosidimutans TaxID=687846 RepID=UPI0033780596